MKKNLENNLHNLYTNIEPTPNPKGMQDTIMQVRQIVNQSQYRGLTFWQFYVEQIKFIRKNVWIIQFVILLICGLRLFNYTNSIQTISWISAATPLIFLSGITELSRTYTYGTIEIELSTQYTLSQVMMSRISILGLIDILSLTILCVFVGSKTSLENYTVFLYIYVPFMVTSFGCLWLLNRIKSKECNYYCFALGIFIMATISFLTSYFPNMYVKSTFLIWNVLLLLSVVGVCLEIYKLLSSCNKKLDCMNLSNI